MSHNTSYFISSGTLNRPEGETLGFNSYSYKLAADCFGKFFEAQGFQWNYLTNPEIYSNKIAQKDLGISNRKVHICFRPLDSLRLLDSAVNIAYVFWEFDVIDKAFGTQSYLRLFDQIWVSNKYAKECLEKNGFENVHIVKIPFEFKQSSSAEEKKFDFSDTLAVKLSDNIAVEPKPIGDHNLSLTDYYFMVLNPWDNRKQLAESIEAFKLFNRANDGKYTLIIKAIIDNETTNLINLNEIVQIKSKELGFSSCTYEADNVYFISAMLPQDMLFELYRRAKYLVSFSKCEGFNLPLIEAWSNGTASIHSMNTAMLEYTPHGYPLANVEKKKLMPKSIRELYGFESDSKVGWFGSEVEDIVDLLQASITSRDIYERYVDFIQEAVGFATTLDEIESALR